MTLSFRPIAAMLLGIVTMLSQETKSLSPEGTWNGYMDGNPAIALNVHREGDGFAGAVTFFVVTAGAEPVREVKPMRRLAFRSNSLRFVISGPAGDDVEFTFRMQHEDLGQLYRGSDTTESIELKRKSVK